MQLWISFLKRIDILRQTYHNSIPLNLQMDQFEQSRLEREQLAISDENLMAEKDPSFFPKNLRRRIESATSIDDLYLVVDHHEDGNFKELSAAEFILIKLARGVINLDYFLGLLRLWSKKMAEFGAIKNLKTEIEKIKSQKGVPPQVLERLDLYTEEFTADKEEKEITRNQAIIVQKIKDAATNARKAKKAKAKSVRPTPKQYLRAAVARLRSSLQSISIRRPSKKTSIAATSIMGLVALGVVLVYNSAETKPENEAKTPQVKKEPDPIKPQEIDERPALDLQVDFGPDPDNLDPPDKAEEKPKLVSFPAVAKLENGRRVLDKEKTLEALRRLGWNVTERESYWTIFNPANFQGALISKLVIREESDLILGEETSKPIESLKSPTPPESTEPPETPELTPDEEALKNGILTSSFAQELAEKHHLTISKAVKNGDEIKCNTATRNNVKLIKLSDEGTNEFEGIDVTLTKDGIIDFEKTILDWQALRYDISISLIEGKPIIVLERTIIPEEDEEDPEIHYAVEIIEDFKVKEGRFGPTLKSEYYY